MQTRPSALTAPGLSADERSTLNARRASRIEPTTAPRAAFASVIYRLIFKLLLQHIDAERTHGLALRTLRAVTAIPALRRLLRRLTAPDDPRLHVQALGMTFPNPLGVAAGIDKDARSFSGLWALGFGFIEVGTITAHAQSGHAGKRVVRLVADHAVINRMGFPNPGAEVAAGRLKQRPEQAIVGVNVGKSKVVSAEETPDDYARAVRALAPVSDYLVINVSSPNTPGLREMQAVDRLRPLLSAVRSELAALSIEVPVLIKIGPDLTDDQLDAVCDLAVELAIDGIVAVNTTVDRSGLASSGEHARALPGGGLSGRPLKQRSLEVLRRTYSNVGDRMVVISVGGIEDADDVWERILAGATLVQAHTGFVYGGPTWARTITRELARRTSTAGCSSIEQLIGGERRTQARTAAPRAA